MSWLARSITNSLKIDDDDNGVTSPKHESNQPEDLEHSLLHNEEASSPNSPPRGVKNDISDLTQTLTRQFWGVASFLAPPPPPQQPRSDPEVADPDLISGIRSDFSEIGGKFRSGISLLSNNINVSEITKLASDFLQLGSDDEIEEEGDSEGFDSVRKGAVGVTEEVVGFVRDIAMHPETWLDFPLPENVGDDIDFYMSDAQHEHALAVEHVAPTLAALRIELCPGYMTESCFWKIYFVLLHPRLDTTDAKILSTPQIVKARSLLTQELKKRIPIKPENISEKMSFDPKEDADSHNVEPLCVPSQVSSGNESNKASDFETVKHPIESQEIQIVDKSVIEENDVTRAKDHQYSKFGSSNILTKKVEDDADDWLKEEESSGIDGVAIPIVNEDDVSFSDLEEDDAGDVPVRKSSNGVDKDSPDWIQLEKTKKVNVHDKKESSDWLDVDDIDVA